MWENYVRLEQLLCDESFLSWYYQTDPQDAQPVPSGFPANPNQTVLIEQARTFLNSIQIPEAALPPEQLPAAETRLLQYIRSQSIGLHRSVTTPNRKGAG